MREKERVVSEWEYRTVQFKNETGIFVCRGTEWRQFLVFTTDSVRDSVSVMGPSTATEIARAMGWEKEEATGSEPLAPLELYGTAEYFPTVRAKILDMLRRGGIADPEQYLYLTPDAPMPEEVPEAPSGSVRSLEHNEAISVGMGSRWVGGAVARLRELRLMGVSYNRIARKLTDEFGVKFTASMCSSKADRVGIRRIPTTGGRKPKVRGVVPTVTVEARRRRPEGIPYDLTEESIEALIAGMVPPAAEGTIGEDKPAQEAKADEGEQTEGSPEPPAVDVSVASADTANPVAGTTDLAEGVIEGLLEQIKPLTAAVEERIEFYPAVTIPVTVYDVVHWYKSQGYDIGEPGGAMPYRINGEYVTEAELIRRANNQRVASGAKPFVVEEAIVPLSPREAAE